MRKQEAVIKLLRRVVDVIAEEAKNNPEFAKKLEAVLIAPPSVRARKGDEIEEPVELPDIYSERLVRGDREFRMWLRDQPVEVLRGLIRRHDLDAARRTSKWKEAEKLSDYIADQLQSRTTRGASFMRGGGGDDVKIGPVHRSAEWLPAEVFDRTEYGKLNKQPGAAKFIPPYETYEVPVGGRIVEDPKDGKYGIVVDREGNAICKVVLRP
jgi:hypothetical protein